MTTIINTKIGESKNVARLWLEGQKLARAGVKIGMRFAMTRRPGSERIELTPVNDSHQGKTFNVSRRMRRGIEVPLMEIRSDELKQIFSAERVRVAIRQGRIVVTAIHLDVKIRERIRNLVQRMKSGDPLKVCSIFKGGGVLDKAIHSGFVKAGVSSFIQVGVELESAYLDASLRNNPELWSDESIAICSDIREIEWGNNAPQCDLLVGGVPCLGASLSGRSKNGLAFAEEHAEAGALFVDFLSAVKAVNPAVVLLENVTPYMKTASMAAIRSVLVSLGYHVAEKILDGNDFGTLERRTRLAMVATTKGLSPFDFDALVPLKIKEEKISDILEDIPLDSDRWKTFDYLAEKEKKDKAAGKGFRRQLLTGDEGHCGVIGRSYAKCRSTEPYMSHPEDSSLSRIFTPIEHCRLKGIPEEVIAGESDTIAHEILGQSVAFPVFQSVGLAIAEALLRDVSQMELDSVSSMKLAA